MANFSTKSALSSPLAASIAAISGRFLLLGGAALTGILVPLSMSQQNVGLFFLAQALIAALATAGQLGLNITAPALMSSSFGQNDFGRARQTVHRSLLLGAIASILLAVIFNLTASFIDSSNAIGLPSLIAQAASIISVSLVALALVTILTEQHRAVGNFVQASFLAAGATTVSAVTVAVSWWMHYTLPLSHLLMAGALGSFLGCVCGTLSIWRWHGSQRIAPKRPISYASLLSQTRPNLTTTIMFLIVAQADLWIIAAFEDTEGLAVYGLASRLAALILIPLAVVNTVIAPSIGRLWARKKIRYLRKILGIGAGAATVLAIIGYGIFIIIGKFLVVHMWSAEYLNAYYIFAILGLSQLTQTVGGAAGYVLMMLGRQHIAMNVSIGCGLVMIASGVWAMANFGIIGLAIAYSLGGILQSSLMIVYVRRIFDLKTTPHYSNLLRFLRLYLRKTV